VAGNGQVEYGSGIGSEILREVDVPIVSGDDCQEKLRRTALGKYFRLDRQSFICAGGEMNKDSCTVWMSLL
jgi:hypothetical protein